MFGCGRAGYFRKMHLSELSVLVKGTGEECVGLRLAHM